LQFYNESCGMYVCLVNCTDLFPYSVDKECYKTCPSSRPYVSNTNECVSECSSKVIKYLE